MIQFIRSRILSIGFACEGLGELLRSEANVRVHITAAIVVVGLGLWAGLSSQDWAILVLAMAFVLAVEAVNTAIEISCDFINPENHPQIKRIKDVSAAAVLLCAIAAVIVGLLILVPAILARW